MLLREARAYAIQTLRQAAQPEAERKAALLLAQLADCEPSQLYLHWQDEISRPQLESWLARLMAGEPLQYLLGGCGFMGLNLRVRPGVLIPRPDTEIVAERAIQLLRDHPAPVIADIGTGSGALALSLAYHLPRATVYAVDIDRQALDLARENADILNITDRCSFLQGDLGAPLFKLGLRFDLIVSNPPYITVAEMAELAPEVRHEPTLALYGGHDGLDFYRRLAREAGPLLQMGGYLLLEHGAEQQAQVCAILTAADWRIAARLRDYGNRARAVLAC